MAKTPSNKKAAAKKVPDNHPGNVVAQEDFFYEVEDVIGHRQGYRGREEYKIRWKGCSYKDDTWEPHENLCDSAMELAVQFKQREDAKKLVGSSPGHKRYERKATTKKALTKSLRALKSEQSPLIKRNGRTVFGSTRHPNTQVRFLLSPSKCKSNVSNELRIKLEDSPVSTHFFSNPMALPVEEVSDIMVVPLGLPIAALTSTATAIPGINTANLDEEEDDWTCPNCKFWCVCSAGRTFEMITPTLFAAAHSSPSSSTVTSIPSPDGILHDLVSEEEDNYEEISWTCAKCKCTNKGEDCSCVNCSAKMPYEMKSWEGTKIAERLAVTAKAKDIAEAKVAAEAEGARITEEMRPRVSGSNEVGTSPPKTQSVRGACVTMEDTTPRFKHQQPGYNRAPVSIFSSNSEVATPHSKKEQSPKYKRGGRTVLGPILPPNHMSLKLLFTPIKRLSSMAVTPKASNVSKNLRNKLNASPPILVTVPADTNR